jgi:2-hydroxychromene-2-carboxylate isomerase
MRVASHAAEGGRGAAFVLAATRLAFCGGFDLDDPEILAEAAAAAGVVLDDTLHAARDEGRDGAIEGAGRALLAAGADRLPALRIGRALYWGERRVAEALAAARVARVARSVSARP